MLKLLILAWVLVVAVFLLVAIVGAFLLPRDRRDSALKKTNRHYLRGSR